jgi:hypothetical protein
LAKDPYGKLFCNSLDTKLKQEFTSWYEVEYVSCVQSVVPRKPAALPHLVGDPDWENSLQLDRSIYYGPHISLLGNILLGRMIYKTILYFLQNRKSYKIRLDYPIPQYGDRLTRSEELYVNKIMKTSGEHFMRGLRRQ